jgi:molybdopterin-guanine dinucleotide biosynthesis protein A
MGENKALIQIGGRPLIERVASALNHLVPTRLVSETEIRLHDPDLANRPP